MKRLFPQIFVLLLLMSFPNSRQLFGISSTQKEYQVKAAFLFKFLRFIEWPTECLPQDGTFRIGVVGTGPTNEALETISGKEAKGRKCVIDHLGLDDDMTKYQVLFITRSEENRVKSLLQKLRGLPVLTIGEIEDFSEQGGIINFYLDKNKVRFEINVDSAKTADLKISSKLLKLAKIISRNETNGL